MRILIFDEYPITNVYSINKSRNPGTIDIFNGVTRFQIPFTIVNMYAQVNSGPSSEICSDDTYDNRLYYSKKCLIQLNNSLSNTDKVAFPYNIGCELTQGLWIDYYDMINEFKSWNNYKDS